MPQPVSKEIKDRALALVRLGGTVRSVAREVGVSESALHEWRAKERRLEGGRERDEFSLATLPGQGSWYALNPANPAEGIYIRLARSPDGDVVCTGMSRIGDDFAGASSPPLDVPGAVEQIVEREGLALELPAAARLRASRPRRGGEGPTDDELKAFVAVFLAMQATPGERRRPMEAAARYLGVTRGTLHRWRHLAAQKGFLDPDGSVDGRGRDSNREPAPEG